MDEQQHYVPTFIRVWEYRWLIRGLPNGPTFWRPIEVRSAAVFGALLVVEWFVLHRLGVQLDVAGGVLVYLGIPGAAAWWATHARLNGKRLDRWLWDRLQYRFGPKRWDRFRPVPDRQVYIYGRGGGGDATNAPADRLGIREPGDHTKARQQA